MKSLESRILEIEDFYKHEGYSGEKLRKILERDKEWKKLIKKRKQKLEKKFALTKLESEKYVMSTDDDYEILSKIKKIEKMKLTNEKKLLVKLIKSQLEHDWRKNLIKTLNKILQKHSKN